MRGGLHKADKESLMVSRLFDSTSLGGIDLKNRFVRSATWEGMAEEDGACTPALVDVVGVWRRGKSL